MFESIKAALNLSGYKNELKRDAQKFKKLI